jgi:hypothetical protein
MKTPAFRDKLQSEAVVSELFRVTTEQGLGVFYGDTELRKLNF